MKIDYNIPGLSNLNLQNGAQSTWRIILYETLLLKNNTHVFITSINLLQ